MFARLLFLDSERPHEKLSSSLNPASILSGTLFQFFVGRTSTSDPSMVWAGIDLSNPGTTLLHRYQSTPPYMSYLNVGMRVVVRYCVNTLSRVIPTCVDGR